MVTTDTEIEEQAEAGSRDGGLGMDFRSRAGDS